jgi:hypothetical protein
MGRDEEDEIIRRMSLTHSLTNLLGFYNSEQFVLKKNRFQRILRIYLAPYNVSNQTSCRERFTDLDKLDLIKLANGGLVLGLSQYLLLP